MRNISHHITCRLLTAILTLWLLTISNHISATNELPSIGGTAAGSGPTTEEKRLGQTWLRLFRRQAPISSDPLITDYTERLLQRLAKSDPAAGDEFSLVIVRNRLLNAFALPGGVIGVHTGLFNYAEIEDQFASVLAHELAHLSQRHYARNVEKQKSQGIISMATILASLVIAANADGDAGIAALQASQAALIDRRLSFSRTNEEEADRIGMTTLIKAGFDPHAMAGMFEQMQRASRFTSTPPEFLLTHPITAKRIADAKNRAREHPSQAAPSSLDYDLVRARVLFKQEETPQQAINRFQSELRGFSPSAAGSRYGLVLALTDAKQFAKATEALAPLLANYPDHPALIIAQSNIEAGSGKFTQALARIENALIVQPSHYALQFHHSRLLAAKNDHKAAVVILEKLRKERPQDPFIWYHLAEFSGLAGDILTLHKARAEYFILYGNFDSAENQLNNLIRKFADTPEAVSDVAIAKQRLQDVKILRKTSKL